MKEPKDIDAGIHKFLEFHQLEPKSVGHFASSFKIPGWATYVGAPAWVAYKSDKWTGKNERYIHEHELGVKCCVAKGSEITEGPIISIPSYVTSVRTLVRLGACLGFAYVGFDGEEIEAHVSKPFPELFCIPSGRALVVVDKKTEFCAVMWGGSLDVTQRGIEG